MPDMSVIGTGYLAAVGYERDLEAELDRLGPWEKLSERLYLRREPAERVGWAADIWFDLRLSPIDSIGHAADMLRAETAWWGLLPGAAFRRSKLIQDKLPRWRQQDLTFPTAKALRPLGGFTLIDRDTMAWSPATMRPWPAGEVSFIEDHAGPPSRAYRKLWEAFALLGHAPGAGESAWDLGAAPGAWTWAMAELGAEVRSIDRAELDPRVAERANVSHHIGSAFALDPRKDASDWLCSDVICYPGKMATFIDRWLAKGSTERFIVTIKCQGGPDPSLLDEFMGLEDSIIVHLHHNKHEVTWIRHPGLRFGPWPWFA